MDLIKKRIDKYIMSLIEKEKLTPEEYSVLVFEYERRKDDSRKASDDTILRIFSRLN